MLHYFCAIALLIAQVSAEGRYFVGLFQGAFPWAYPLDMCVPSGLLGYPSMMFTCSADGMQVTANTYKSADPTCSQSPAKTTTYTEASAQGNGVYSFYSNGTNHYLATKLYVGSCTSPLTTAVVYSAINSCYKVEHSNTSVYDGFQEAQCNAQQAIIRTYAYPETYTMCDTTFAVEQGNASNITTECTYYLTSSGEDVYAQMYDCVYDGYSQLPHTQDTMMTYPKPEYPIQVINLTATFWPASQSYPDPDLCGYDWFRFFSVVFNGSYVSVTTQCLSDEGVDETYSGLWLEVEIYSDAQYYPPCNNLTYDLWIGLNATKLFNFEVYDESCSEANYTMPPTMEPTMAPHSSAGMQSISLIVIASSLLASMYIL